MPWWVWLIGGGLLVLIPLVVFVAGRWRPKVTTTNAEEVQRKTTEKRLEIVNQEQESLEQEEERYDAEEKDIEISFDEDLDRVRSERDQEEKKLAEDPDALDAKLDDLLYGSSAGSKKDEH